MQLIDVYAQNGNCVLSSCSEDPYSTKKNLFYKIVSRAACTCPLLTACNVHAVAINC